MPALAVLAGITAFLGLAAGVLVDRAAARFPWAPSRRASPRSWRAGRDTPVLAGVPAPGPHDRGEGDVEDPVAAMAVRPLVVLLTAALCGLTAWRFGASAELPAFLVLAVSGVLLGAIDVRHRLLPNRVVFPTLAAGAVLLTGAAAVAGEWPALLRAVLAAGAVFGVLLVMALVSPAGMGMGDVKLGAVLGLHLGWLGWPHVVLGLFAGFAVQAVLALVLLVVRRIGLRSELPFGPALLVGTGAVVLAPLVT
ncbi:prepilin peptidase [Geodermatophilus marinus]|uniref:prepilin peptidase n=1 Tax=Geodermatophilus sp. LHW52908 TaxID=2303986 RepID=UPI000E3CA9BA|nr:A24 family peptidase [Geodermatophilus sp. LHW52908]RFU19038.1 prepilin peptidase [Geodermatophilus sp. LHW52908]